MSTIPTQTSGTSISGWTAFPSIYCHITYPLPHEGSPCAEHVACFITICGFVVGQGDHEKASEWLPAWIAVRRRCGEEGVSDGLQATDSV